MILYNDDVIRPTMKGKTLIMPSWLDSLLFEQLGAKYNRSYSDMTVVDWNKEDILDYLGTYFPRSYTESFSIISQIYTEQMFFLNKEEISILDFGCGTGGEIFGILSAIDLYYPTIKKVNIIGLDGNQHALKLYEKILEQFSSYTRLDVCNRIAPIRIADFYDLSIIDEILDSPIDLFISFKAICEFVTKQCFEKNNAYEHIIKTFMPKLNSGGLMMIEDVSSYNDVSQEWLPKMMDKGIKSAGYSNLMQNKGYNQTYSVSHSRKKNDLSKVAWRIIKKDK